MYHVDGERYVKFTGSFGDPLLIMALCVTYEDGTAEEFVTDGVALLSGACDDVLHLRR